VYKGSWRNGFAILEPVLATGSGAYIHTLTHLHTYFCAKATVSIMIMAFDCFRDELVLKPRTVGRPRLLRVAKPRCSASENQIPQIRTRADRGC
jgi:hypothetical protein